MKTIKSKALHVLKKEYVNKLDIDKSKMKYALSHHTDEDRERVRAKEAYWNRDRK